MFNVNTLTTHGIHTDTHIQYKRIHTDTHKHKLYTHNTGKNLPIHQTPAFCKLQRFVPESQRDCPTCLVRTTST